MGLHITIDDFVGEVGLSSISQMQVSSVKIDRLLVKKMGDPVEAITVQRMIAVATTLGMNVVGKGVETDEEKVFLANSGSQAQGFLLGHPVPAYEIGKILQQNVSPVSSKTRRQRVGE
jgi:EAL domain-containing protein (putative c-di-GMP-specific phosphodiesterase class I)